MTTEQKAKAYEEALEIARKELLICGSTDCDAARQIYRFFPELAENEDERIRKTLVELVKCNERSGYTILNNIPTSSMLAWLEKQEQKSWSEEDEQHRKWILAYLYDGLFKADEQIKGQFKTAIAWFEKQRNKE